MPLLLNPIGTTDYVRGNPDALVSVIEYGDFQSPECKRAAEIMKRVLRTKGDSIAYAYRHFTREEIHRYAERAAEATEAAAGQDRDKFWEMHDMLFEHQDALDDDSLTMYADLIGLDLDQFTEDMTSHRYLRRVNRDYVRGLQSGVHNPPTFFLSNRMHEGPTGYSELLRSIREAHKRVIEGFV